MVSNDDTAVANRLDIKMLMETMGDLSLSIEKIRENVTDSEEKLQKEMKTFEEHMMYQFKLSAELIRSDLFDAKGDRITQHHNTLADHTRRIVRIEQKLAI